MSISTIARFKSGKLHISETVYTTIMQTFERGQRFHLANVAHAISCRGVDVVVKASVCEDDNVIGKNQIRRCLSDWSKYDWQILKRLKNGWYVRQ